MGEGTFKSITDWLYAHSLAELLLLSFLLAIFLRRQRRAVLGFAAAFTILELARGILPPGAATAPLGGQRVLYCLIVFVQGLLVLRLVSIALFQLLLPAIRRAPPRIMQDVAEAGAYIAWALLWMTANGVDATGLLTTSAILTAVIGLAFQDTLGNIISGLAIQLDRSFHVGDWIRYDGIDGKVSEIRWRYTAIETRNWETVLIPNSQLAKNKLMILGRKIGEPTRWRRWVYFNVDFRFPPNHVIQTVEKALLNSDIPRVAREPSLNCVLMELGESFGRYAVRYWLDSLEADDPIDSAVRQHIFVALERAGIPLSIPAQALFVTEETPERKEQKLAQNLTQRRDVLRKIGLFDSLDDDELDDLAGHLVPAPFLDGDVITRQGTAAHWLYIILEGKADVVVSTPSGHSDKVAELADGDFFGEMALMTGQPRRATVVARSPMKCYRLDKESFSQIITARPGIAAHISKVLAQRAADLEAKLQHLDAAETARRLASKEKDILAKVKSMFGLSN